MDRRQRKTRQAIFNAFTELLSKKSFNRITVGEIIAAADVGRATFYSHFETKDYLLKEFCRELFCHLYDAESKQVSDHKHIFDCDTSDTVFCHLFQHLEKNDNNILVLLSSENNELFLNYFKKQLEGLIDSHFYLFEYKNKANLPLDFFKDHIACTFVNTVRWWIDNGMKESPDKITGYFLSVV